MREAVKRMRKAREEMGKPLEEMERALEEGMLMVMVMLLDRANH